MARLVLTRTLAAFPLLLGVLTLTFVLIEAAPGGPVELLVGDRPVPPEVRERIEEAYGLDRPPLERYGRWLASVVLRGDLGWSVSRSRPVSRVLADTLPNTLLLGGAALAIHLVLGLALGIVGARFRGRWPDRILSTGSLAVWAMPVFWVGLMAILLLSYRIPLFPPSSVRSLGAHDWPLARRGLDVLWHLALPAGTLGVASAAAMARFVRAGLLDALGEAFVTGARARGAGGPRVLLAHALRNAVRPAIQLVGLSLPVLVSGSLVIEVVFAWPGIGRLAYEAILARDLPVVLATTLLSSVLVIAGSLLADLGQAWADPRVRIVGTAGALR